MPTAMVGMTHTTALPIADDVAALLEQLENGTVTVDDIIREAQSACLACGIELD